MISVKNRSDTYLIFYDVPKNSSTSIKKLFIDIMGVEDQFDFYGEQYIDEGGNRVDNMEASREYKERTDRERIMGGKTRDFHEIAHNRPFLDISTTNFSKPYSTMALVRDPAERFRSVYNHLIKVNKEYNWTVYQALEMVMDGTMVNNHFWPQTHFLGTDPSYFNYLYKMEDGLDDMVRDINFFMGSEAKLKHYQTSGSSIPFESERRVLSMIREAYASDYKFIEDMKS